MEDRAFSAKTVYPHKAEELFSNPTPEVYFSWLSTTESIDQLSQEFSNILKEDGFEGNFQIGVVDSNSEVIYTSKNGEATFEYANEEKLAETVFSPIYSKIVKLAKEESFNEAATEWDKFCNGKTFEIEYKDLAQYVSYVTALKDCSGDTWIVSNDGIAALKGLPDSFEKKREYYDKINAAIKSIRLGVLQKEQGRDTYCVNVRGIVEGNYSEIFYKEDDSFSSLRIFDSYYYDFEESTTYEITDGQVTAITAGGGLIGYDLGFAARIALNDQGAIVGTQKFSRSTANYFVKDRAEEFAGTYYWAE